MRNISAIAIAASALLFVHCSGSKKIDAVVTPAAVNRIESILSHDSMEGRQVFTDGIEKAAAFIADEMKTAGLKPFKSDGFLHAFEVFGLSVKEATVSLGDSLINGPNNVVCLSASKIIAITPGSNYRVTRLKAGADYSKIIGPILNSDENELVFIDQSFAARFPRLRTFTKNYYPKSNNVVFVLTTNAEEQQYNISIVQEITIKTTSNIIGLLPGKSLSNEYVIFSGHYDHLGFSRADSTGDSLYNGANDNASGTTAMLMLAKYYAARKNNERSLLFVAFSAEELGLYGSTAFAETINAKDVIAMFNIEMIGTASKWGKNAAFITGYERSDVGKMMQKNLEGSGFSFYPDPYGQYKLFLRSDNASLAKKGVPAHTISTSQMDAEPHYHKPSDEIKTLDLDNMTRIIKSIYIASQSIVSGKDTPGRIRPEEEHK